MKVNKKAVTVKGYNRKHENRNRGDNNIRLYLYRNS